MNHHESSDNDPRKAFIAPVIRREGSLTAVTATASGIGFSDANLKKDVAPYADVLPRLRKLN